MEILPAGDAIGSHGKTYRFCGFDEIHGYKTWDILEAMQLDPTRPDSLMWVASYASLHHKPGIPLFDLFAIGKKDEDPRMFFSWYAADFCTDPSFEHLSPEDRANPSRESWKDSDYLEQQKRRLPAHKYRRLHLNLPGLPEGSAFSVEKIMDAIEAGISIRPYSSDLDYVAFVDMSGGSNDDACLSIAHLEGEDEKARAALDVVINQGAPCPFDPRRAVQRFARTLKKYRISVVTGDKYAGETFINDFEREGISYQVSEFSKSEIYESLEPHLNAGRVLLLDNGKMESQFLGLIWRGSKIDHPNGEHDDFANAAAGAIQKAFEDSQGPSIDDVSVGGRTLATASMRHVGLGTSRRNDGPWADDRRDIEVCGDGNEDGSDSIFNGLDDYGDW